MYCRRCLYPLAQIKSRNCPECGRAFDPDDPRTYRGVPRHKASFLKHIFWGAFGALIFACLLVVLILLDLEGVEFLALPGYLVGSAMYDTSPYFILWGFIVHFASYAFLGVLAGAFVWTIERPDD